MKSTTIVLATDLSDGARSAAVWARDMGTRTGLPVIVTHIVELGFDSWVHGKYQIADDAGMRRTAEQGVSKWYQEATGEPPAQVEIRIGHAVHELVAVAKQYEAAMLVMAPTGKSTFTRTVVGSRVQQLIAMPPCPVVIVDPISFTLDSAPRIAAAVDFSPSTPEVVGIAGSLATMAKSPLILAHVFEPPRMFGGVDLLSAEQTAEMMSAAEAELTTVAKTQLPGMDLVETRVMVGEPARCLVELSRNERIDILVLGHTGHWPTARELLGSCPRKLVGNQPCTLIIAPTPRPAAADEDE